MGGGDGASGGGGGAASRAGGAGGGTVDGATGAGGAAGGVAGGDPVGAMWCVGELPDRGVIGVNSPGFHVCGIRRIDGSFRKRSAWPHPRQIRVPSESSPRDRRESEPPPIPPVLRSFAQTKSDAPQLLQTGANRFTLPAT